MSPSNETQLARCIRLRERCRQAIDDDDLDTMITFNRLADEAYLMLTPLEQSAYCAWAFQEAA